MSTSAYAADVTDVVLRSADRRRLVFRVMLVSNPHNTAASVRGTLVYQAETESHEWIDIDGLSLANLRADQWTKLEPRSEELLRLFQAVSGLYAQMREHVARACSMALWMPVVI